MEYIKLKEVCDLKNGFAFKSSDYIEYSNVLNCRMSNIRPNATFDAEYNPKYLPEEFCEKYEEYLLKDGDLIIAMTDLANDPKLLGVPTIVDTKGYKMLLNQRVGKLILLDKNRVLEAYLKYALSLPQHKNYFKKFAGGGLQINIGKQEILNLEIPYCDVKTQKKIVEVLDKAQELIDKRKEQIKSMDEVVKSRFIEMFGDPVKNPKNLEKVYLKDISELITKGSSPNWQGIEYVEDESQTLFVTSENVREGYIDLSKKKYLMDEFNDKQKRSILKKGDFLINIVGASIGRAAQFNLDTKANINQAVALVRIKNGLINDKYLLTYLNSPKALAMYESMQVSVARANLSLQNINDLEILLPPIELQNEFADFVKQVEKLKSQMEDSLKELEDNFNSLMQKAFKGELF